MKEHKQMDKLKLYCYADETGQDTKGRFFLVSVIILEGGLREGVEASLKRIETKTKKYVKKWRGTKHNIRIDYLWHILQIKKLRSNIFYATYQNQTDYIPLIAQTIIKVILLKAKGDYQATIFIDGINEAEQKIVKKLLKESHIRYRKIRGPKDESTAFLRLADAVAGFLRDYHERQAYTYKLYRAFQREELISEVK